MMTRQSSYARVVGDFIVVLDNKEICAGPVDKDAPGLYRIRLTDIQMVFDTVYYSSSEYFVSILVGSLNVIFKGDTARAFVECYDAWRTTGEIKR